VVSGALGDTGINATSPEGLSPGLAFAPVLRKDEDTEISNRRQGNGISGLRWQEGCLYCMPESLRVCLGAVAVPVGGVGGPGSARRSVQSESSLSTPVECGDGTAPFPMHRLSLASSAPHLPALFASPAWQMCQHLLRVIPARPAATLVCRRLFVAPLAGLPWTCRWYADWIVGMHVGFVWC
jgi:hypothetical protein